MSSSDPPIHRSVRIAALLLGGAVAVGCQTYQAQPLDLPAHRAAYMARLVDPDAPRQFALRLQAIQTARGEDHAPPFDAADGLSADEGQLVALVYNVDLRTARLRADVTRVGVAHAGLWDDPTLGVDVERILSGGMNPWIAGGSLAITLPVSGRLEAERRRAEAAGEMELRRVAAREWAVRWTVRAAWSDWSAAQMRAQLARDHVTRLKTISERADRLEAAGELTRVEARVFRIELAGRAAEADLLDARAAEARIALLGLMGLAPDTKIELHPDPAYAAPAMAPAQRVAAMEDRHPELTLLRAEYEVAERTLKREIQAQYPDLTIGPGGRREDGDTRAVVGLSLPLPLWNRNQRGVAEAHAARNAARGDFEAAHERLTTTLHAAWTRHRAAAAHRARIETHLLPLVQEQAADARRLAEAGRIDPLLILDALTRLHAVQAGLIDAVAAEAAAAVRLEELTGPPEPNAQTPAANPKTREMK